jgi:hypothetical protein
VGGVSSRSRCPERPHMASTRANNHGDIVTTLAGEGDNPYHGHSIR